MKNTVSQFALLLFVIFTGCKKSDSPAPPPPSVPPAINSFSPIHALPGASVTITGTNFSAVATNNTVKINGVDAMVTAATATQLTVTVPASATTGKIMVSVGSLFNVSTNDFEVLKDIPRNGLVAFYSFSGNANDASGNNLNGTINGATLAADRYGNNEKTYAFNGTSNYISLGNPAALKLSNKITVACWIKPTTIDYMTILSKYIGSGDGKKGFYLSMSNISSVGRFGFYVNDQPGLNYLSGNFNANSWIFIATTLEGTNIGYFFNATNDMNQTNSPPLTDCADADLIIGSNSTHNAFYFKGSIDDIVIYNRKLTADEITQVYQQTVTKY